MESRAFGGSEQSKTAQQEGEIISTAIVPTIRGAAEFSVARARGREVTVIRFLGRPADGRALVRIHSACATSELFGSLKCDCREQLHLALDLIARAGGALIYEQNEEGRGIGLANKIAAYALQARGFDTFAANRALGLPEDARDFGASGDILAALDLGRIALLTNNPSKVEALRKRGLDVEARPLVAAATPENMDYLLAKQRTVGHLLGLEA